MFGLADQRQDRATDGSPQADKGRQVDGGGGKEAGDEGQPRDAADACDLRRMDAKTRNEPGGKHGSSATALEQTGGALERLAGMERLGHLHQALPAKQREDLSAEDRAADGGYSNRAHQRRGARASTGNSNAADGEHDVAGGEGQRHSQLLDEQQRADHGDQAGSL